MGVKVKAGLVFAATVFSAVCSAETCLAEVHLHLVKGMHYTIVRDLLIRKGFTPVESKRHYCAPGMGQRCEWWAEVEACGGTGLAPCTFLWRKGNVFFEVDTYGEENPPRFDGVRCRSNCRKKDIDQLMK